MRAVIILPVVGAVSAPGCLSAAEVEALLDGVAASGHRVVPLQQLLARPGVPDQIALAFDVGHASTAEEALPVLAHRGLVATVFARTGAIGAGRHMGWGELESLAEAGWEIGSHSCSELSLTGMTHDEMHEVVGRASEDIQRHLGRPATCFAHPGGAADKRTSDVVGVYHRYGFTRELAPLDPSTDHPLRLPRLDGTALRRRWTHRMFDSSLLEAWLVARRNLFAARERLRWARRGTASPTID